MTECEMEDEWDVTNYEYYSRYVIWALAILGILMEVNITMNAPIFSTKYQ